MIMTKTKNYLLLIISFFLLAPLGASAEPPLSYELDWEIVERRHVHQLEDFMNDLLDLQYDQIIFEYNSLGADMHTPVRLTASIAMPPNVYNKLESPRALFIYNQYTTAKHRERASQDPDVEYGLLLNKLQNFIVISPDLYGWTLTEDKPQAFCCPEITGVESSDAWDAAMQILAQEGYAYENLPIINMGYSAGGFSAMAVDKYFNEHRPDVKFDITAAGGAPHDPTTIYENYVKTNYTRYPCALPLMMVAYKETYGLPVEYSDIFKKPLCDNIDNWILSKDYNTWEINGLIGEGTKVNEMLTPVGCDYTRGKGKVFYDKFRDKSLCGPWPTWQPSTETQYFILHSEGDTYIYNHVGMEMANYLEDHGCKTESDFFNWGDHIYYAGFVFVARVLLKTEMIINDGRAIEILESILENIDQYINIADFVAKTKGHANVESMKNIRAIEAKAASDEGHYYTLDGEQLSGNPTKPGLYIKNGHKVMVLSTSSILGNGSDDSEGDASVSELRGDMNNDGDITISDVTTLVNMILSK